MKRIDFQPDSYNLSEVLLNRRPKRLPLYEHNIELYNDRIGLFGGFDLNLLIMNKYDDIYREVLEKGTKFRNIAKGYGLGSGNSISGDVHAEGYQAMIDASKEIRKKEEAT